MTRRATWVFLLYRLPREPSTPRISLWRKLRRLGAVQLVDSVAALPADPRTREQLEWLADEVTEAGGDASVWTAEATSVDQEVLLVERMTAAIVEEYRQVEVEAEAALAEEGAARTLSRLRRELYRIRQRDYFPPPEREAAAAAVARLAGQVSNRQEAETP